MADDLEEAGRIDYHDIPHFPVSTVKGHAGRLVIGKLEGQTVVAMQGRIHFYEGYTMQQVAFPVRVFSALGVKTLIVTCSSGGINPLLYPGAIMFIKDHINLMGTNPLIGPNDERLGTRFPDMMHAYDRDLLHLGQNVAKSLNIKSFTGVHSAVTGPTFETAAEIRMLQVLGADTVGMSVIPEVIAAVHARMRVLGITAITDMALANPDVPVTHEEVIKVANEIKPKFAALLRGIVGAM